MASSLIISWQKDDEKLETVADFIFLDSKITVDGDFNHEINKKKKGHMYLGRNSMAKLDSILKSRDLAMITKVHSVKAMVFPIVMYGCKSWT